MRARPARSMTTAALTLATALSLNGLAAEEAESAALDEGFAAPTTTVAAGAQTSTTTAGPTTTAVTTTTEAGPPPRGSRRVAAAVDSEKIRPVSIPARTLGVVTAAVIVGLAALGFAYGRFRSRTPAPAAARRTAPPASAPRPVTATPSPTAPAVAGNSDIAHAEASSDDTPAAGPVAELPPPTPLPPPQEPPTAPDAVTDWAPPSR